MTDLMLSPEIVLGASGYTYQSSLLEGWKAGQFSHFWTLGARPVSARLTKKNGGGVWKIWERVNGITTQTLDSLEAVGVRHPGSYASCYHLLAEKTPRVKHTYNAMFDWWLGGPWEAALRQGVFRGKWYRYDLVSAYRWAASLGLPDVRSYRAHVTSRPSNVAGLWVMEWNYAPPKNLPQAFRRYDLFVMSSEELRSYKIASKHARVLRGIRWDSVLPTNYVERTLSRLPTAKKSGRAYWGRWIGRDPLTVHTQKSTWKMPNRDANFVWGWLIVGRVRSRLWQHHAEAAHVYVDEVVLPYEIPTGANHGDWHLKEVYENGIFVRRTGWFGGVNKSRPAMKTGDKTQ